MARGPVSARIAASAHRPQRGNLHHWLTAIRAARRATTSTLGETQQSGGSLAQQKHGRRLRGRRRYFGRQEIGMAIAAVYHNLSAVVDCRGIGKGKAGVWARKVLRSIIPVLLL